MITRTAAPIEPVHGLKLLELPEDYAITEANMDRWYRAGDGHNEWASRAKQAIDFHEGRHWTSTEQALLRKEGRPCLTYPFIPAMIRLLQGYFRQNAYDPAVMPAANGTGTNEMADIITHMLKIIGEANGSRWKSAEIFIDGLVSGRGYWDTRLDFSNNIYGDIVNRICDPFDIRVDPEAETYETEGWNFACEERWLSIADIYTLYKDDGLTAVEVMDQGINVSDTRDISGLGTDRPSKGFGLDTVFTSDYRSSLAAFGRSIDEHINLNRKTIRVIDCQHRVLKRVNSLVDLTTGNERILPDDWDYNKLSRVMQWSQQRQMPVDIRSSVKKVLRWTTTAGDKIMWDDWSPYRDMTFTPYFPQFRRGFTKGAVDDLVDPQKEINKRSSAMLHIIMSTANAGWTMEENALDEENKQLLREEGSRPGIILEHRKDKVPTRIQPAIPPASMKMLVDQAEYNLKQIAGINDSALGGDDRVQSGKAIQARQSAAAMGTEIYYDNFSRTNESRYNLEINLMQDFYTEQRIYATVGDDGQDMLITLNKKEAAGQIVNNITNGDYKVAVEETPMSASFLQAQFEEGLRMITEAGIAIPQDIMVDMSSMPKKDVIKERLKEDSHIQKVGARLQMGMDPMAPLPPVNADGPVTVPIQPNMPMANEIAPEPVPSGMGALNNIGV